ncbi:MAG: hypothetical protein ACREB3_12740, partial [Burkholderiales bacterium]
FAETPLTQFTMENKDLEQQAVEEAAQALAQGDLTRLRDISSFRGSERLLIFARAKKLNPAFNTAEVERKIKMEDYYANGKGADNLRSFDIFLQHAGAAKQAIEGIRVTNSRALNRGLNWWRQNMASSPELINLMGALEPVRKELESFLLGGRALYADDRAQAEKILSDISTPAEIASALTRMGHTAQARLVAENKRYKKLLGKDLQDPLSEEALEGARIIGAPIVFGEKAYGRRMVRMVSPDGTQEADVPEDQVAAAEAAGAKRKQ